MKSFSGKFVALPLLLAAALWACFTLADAVNQSGTQLGLLEGQIQLQNQAVSRLANVRTILNSVSGDQAAIRAYFVSDAQVVAFINDLEGRGAALGSHVSINSVSSRNAGTAGSLALSLSITGSFSAVMRTIGAIEYAPYDLSISDLTLVQSGKGGWAATLTMSVGSAPDAAAPTTSGV